MPPPSITLTLLTLTSIYTLITCTALPPSTLIERSPNLSKRNTTLVPGTCKINIIHDAKDRVETTQEESEPMDYLTLTIFDAAGTNFSHLPKQLSSYDYWLTLNGPPLNVQIDAQINKKNHVSIDIGADQFTTASKGRCEAEEHFIGYQGTDCTFACPPSMFAGLQI